MLIKVGSLLAWLISRNKRTKKAIVLCVDIFMIAISIWLAYSLRFGEIFSLNQRQIYLSALLIFIAVITLFIFGVYRAVVRFFGLKSAIKIIYALLVSSLLWSSVAFLLQEGGASGVPRTIPLLFFGVASLLLLGPRMFASFLLLSQGRLSIPRRNILIYGAGNSGRQLAASLQHSSELIVAGFIDDQSTLEGADINGIRVYSSENVQSLVDRFEIKEIILSSPNVSNQERRKIISFLEKHHLKVRILPAISDLVSGRHIANMVREFDVDDLLGRESVTVDNSLLSKIIFGKVVLVTGAGGSIGSELCRQIINLNPSHIVLLEISELALYQVDRDLRKSSTIKITSVLGSIRDYDKVRGLILEHQIDTIYHAAAYKHVPLVEANVKEGVLNNIYGTRAILSAAYDCAIHLKFHSSEYKGPMNVVMISSDKAVRPTNVMGATKRWAEMLLEFYSDLAKNANTNQVFTAVRFGNVLGSSGSVVPLFKEQILNGGPITLTHRDVTRYFMSIHEAVGLVIQAGSMAEGGEIFLLDMGNPVKIYDLAKSMIMLFGKQGEVDIEVTGLRPGEKLYEELLVSDENARPTNHPQIMKAVEHFNGDDNIEQLMQSVDILCKSDNQTELKKLLIKIAQ